MKWALAGLSFALAVALSIATTAFRAENVRLRLRLEAEYRRVDDRVRELRRLSVEALEQQAPGRLAAALRAHLADEAQRRERAWQ